VSDETTDEERRGRLEVYFDYSSPFAYLGTTQVRRVARRLGAELVYRPFLLGALFRAVGTPMVPVASFSETKRRHYLKDLVRWSEWWGVRYAFNTHFPLRTVDPLRLTLLCPAERRPELVDALMAAYWAHNRPADRDTLVEAVRRTRVDAALLDELESPEARHGLRQATDEAVERGVPGAPTFVVTAPSGEQELFWGQDRLPLVEAMLAGEARFAAS
jgi:2-hydroxychromene-2-carboxylate isomerase